MLTYQNENIGESYAFRSRYHHPGYSVPPHIHEYSELMIGRMGMPYKQCGLYIINVTLDGMEDQIESLSHKLQLLPGISVKTTYARGDLL